jgi:hypothetical protein
MTSRVTSSCVTLLFAIAGCAAEPPSPSPEAEQIATSGLSVSGKHIYLDGQPFVPRGFVMKGLMDNPKDAGGCMRNAGRDAPDGVFNQTNWLNIRDTWHANTLRIHVSQTGLWGGGNLDGDHHPISENMANDYAAYIEDEIHQITTNLGLVVVLSMQDEPPSCGYTDALPSNVTWAAWNRLLSRTSSSSIRNNQKVMINLFNEPKSDTTSNGWAQWAHGGDSPLTAARDNNGHTIWGHQKLIDHIRGLGVTNVIVADGGQNAGKLTGMEPDYDLTDSSPGARGLVYDVHPLFFGDTHQTNTTTNWNLATWDTTRWDARFNSTKAVIAGAWDVSTDECGMISPEATPFFLDTYMKGKGIGVIVYSYDADIGTGYVTDWNGTPNTGHCSDGAPYPGTAFLHYLNSF